MSEFYSFEAVVSEWIEYIFEIYTCHGGLAIETVLLVLLFDQLCQQSHLNYNTINHLVKLVMHSNVRWFSWIDRHKRSIYFKWNCLAKIFSSSLYKSLIKCCNSIKGKSIHYPSLYVPHITGHVALSNLLFTTTNIWRSDHTFFFMWFGAV